MYGLTIQPISEEHFEGFHECLDIVSRERRYLGYVQAPPLEATRRWLKEGMARGTIRLVAPDGPRVVGWCDIEASDREGFTHAGQLGMGVLKAFQGRGIGTKLLGEALALARDQGMERIELDVYASNIPAIRLYEKYGFQIEGRKYKARKIDGSYDDIIIMALLNGQ